MNITKSETSRVTLRMPKDVYKDLKREAIDENVTVTTLLNYLISVYLNSKESALTSK